MSLRALQRPASRCVQRAAVTSSHSSRPANSWSTVAHRLPTTSLTQRLAQSHRTYSQQSTYYSHPSASNPSHASAFVIGATAVITTGTAVYLIQPADKQSAVAYADSDATHSLTASTTVDSPSSTATDVSHHVQSDLARLNKQLHAPSATTPIPSDVTLAPRWKRVIAGVADSFVISGMSSVISYFFVGNLAVMQIPLMALGNIIYECGSNIQFRGQTLGKLLMGIRIVREDQQEIDVKTAAILYGTKLLNVIFLSDYLWGLFNFHGDYKCLHNVFSSTVVAEAS